MARAFLEDRSMRRGWAVVYGGTAIGGIGIRLDVENRAAELGGSIARREWGKGFATEGAAAVLDAAFNADPELNRVRARADARSVASLRVMAKLGMTNEGCLRQNRVVKGELVDMASRSGPRCEAQFGSAATSVGS